MSTAIPMHTQVGKGRPALGSLRVVMNPPAPFAVIQRLGILVPEVIATVDKEVAESWHVFCQRALQTAQELEGES